MNELMSDKGFKLMSLSMKIMDVFYPYVVKRAKTFGIKHGMTVVDYGCGPGRYTVPFAQLVGEYGKVIAVDLKEVALEEVKEKTKKQNLNNVQFHLAKGYDSGVDSEIADMVFSLDMFFMVQNPTQFLTELSRMTKSDGILVIDDGHQSRKTTKMKIIESRMWDIVEETKDHLKCKKITAPFTAR
jgi:ubiquinone/menaquinone biosynthesis C-methylase UbiE